MNPLVSYHRLSLLASGRLEPWRPPLTFPQRLPKQSCCISAWLISKSHLEDKVSNQNYVHLARKLWPFSDMVSGMLWKVLKHNRAMDADGALLAF